MDKRVAYLVRHPELVEPEEPEQKIDADGTAS
jgi:hypothetical protein